MPFPWKPPTKVGIYQSGCCPSQPMSSSRLSPSPALAAPEGQGRLIVQGIRRNDVWDYPVMYVLGDDKQTFDLTALDDAEAAGECALQECRARGGCSEGLAL